MLGAEQMIRKRVPAPQNLQSQLALRFLSLNPLAPAPCWQCLTVCTPPDPVAGWQLAESLCLQASGLITFMTPNVQRREGHLRGQILLDLCFTSGDPLKIFPTSDFTRGIRFLQGPLLEHRLG